jgi:GWxTD domain-containing protein
MKRAEPARRGSRPGWARGWLIALVMAILLLPIPAQARGIKLDLESEQFYHLARHFLTREESRIFLNLATPELRQEFIAAFWEIRDPDPATEENEFRDEIEDRFEFVNRYFNEPSRDGWKTDRGMVYLVLGPPNSENQISSLNDAYSTGYIRWYYGNIGFYVQFVDREGYGLYELDMTNTPLVLMDYLNLGKNRLLTGSEKEIASRYLKFDAKDDAALDRLTILVDIKDLAYETGPDNQRVARLQVSLNLYLPDGTIKARSEEYRLKIDAETLKDGRLHVDLTLPLAKGRNHVDVMVRDRIGEKMNRKIITIKKK